ncbi:ankyrin repeat-containing protein ITN1-like [Populus nigra]|uniref:ankyrin repeat-containing protein ITN1-like n=1 Tax=Populus nigra TaxID=3691 RepID=UPI002B27AC62|nr:ankyrin repeat-containing protein ITN1-like [Populus nigra]
MIGWPVVERIQKEKHKHESALELAQELIKKNQRKWWQSIKVKPTKVNIETPGQGSRGGQSERQGGGGIPGVGGEGQEGARVGVDTGKGGGGGEVENNENVQPKIEENRRQDRPPSPPNPLFIATSNGIVEIAEEILDKFPQGIELVNDEGQNILHVAVMHRRREIFGLVKKKNILVTRLSSSVDNNGFTLLHQVAHVKHYSGGAKPGPALQLQEEIKWFKRVQMVVPPSLSEQRVRWVLPNEKNDKLMTAFELFQEEHKGQLKLAQDWIEKTSQSCSAVAVLLATVVFAAAYTIPGGSDDRGFPIFLHNRFFIAFTVLDVTALASSLTSVVMFLSILTTPFECEKFYHNIPRKLICGFTLLFFSVMTTMLAFSCTLLLVVRLKKQWTTGLMSIAAFLPVSVFAVMQFPLYVAFMTTMKDFFKEVVKFLPWIHLPFRSHFRQGKARRR